MATETQTEVHEAQTNPNSINDKPNEKPNEKPNAAMWRQCAIDTSEALLHTKPLDYGRLSATRLLGSAANKAVVEDKVVTTFIDTDMRHLETFIKMGVIVYGRVVKNGMEYTFRFDLPIPSSLRL